MTPIKLKLKRINPGYVLASLVVILWIAGSIVAQVQNSGGAAVTANAGTNLNTSSLALEAGGNLATIAGAVSATRFQSNLSQVNGATVAVAASGIQKIGLTDGTGNAVTSTTSALDINIKSGSIANTAFALNAGVANIGFVRILPSSCTQSTNFSNSTVGVAITSGTTVTSTTTCVTLAYANNITNSAVTLRLADRQGTPVIWLGGNADFSIPANSNIRIPLDGVIFTSGITAIAGTASAVNLQINGVQ